jgi:acyl-lipid omega-6 desaturase (Delta-12 desaturase)
VPFQDNLYICDHFKLLVRTGKELILATKPFAHEIKWKSWYFTLSTLLLLVVFILISFNGPHIAIRLAASIGTGFLLSRMFVIYHDYAHHSILNKSPLAKMVFSIFGLHMLAPISIWKRSHDYHHKNNSKLFSASIGSYPIFSKQKFLSATPAERRQYLAVRHPLNMIFGYFTLFSYGMSISSFISSPRRHYDSLIALLIHLAYWVLTITFFGWVTWLLVIIIPFSIACGFGAYLFYAQHNFPEVTFKNNIEWSYDHAALESSSYMKMNPFWQWVTANIGFHHIHHLNAKIPFYRLPEAMKAIPELQQAKITTLWPSDIIKCLRLKIWDSDQQRMIPLTEM